MGGVRVPRLRKQVTGYLIKVAAVATVLLLALFIFFQSRGEQERLYADAREMFTQIEQILVENRQELEALRAEYKESTLHRAENVAEILREEPEAVNDRQALQRIADMVEVDEIHIFDKKGVIVAGTVPAYYGYSFDDGEQIGFFKPLLEDKSLRLVQDITPNTAVSMPMQYSALWSSDGERIVQVGMYPANVLKVTEKNELSYIFSLLYANTDVRLYAVDRSSGLIRGATVKTDVGKTLEELGLSLETALTDTDGFHARINGESVFCLFTVLDNNLIGYITPRHNAGVTILGNSVMMTLGLLLITFLMMSSVSRFLEKYVIRGVTETNDALKEITRGDLGRTVNIRSNLEFSELSDHINAMVKSLLASTRKIAFVLDQTDLNIGVYEYSENMDWVRYTEHVPQILAFSILQDNQLAVGREAFQAVVNSLRRAPLPGEEGVYILRIGDRERYIRLEEVHEGYEITGIVVDETEEIQRRREIEKQRDMDPLTGILNRRGLDNALARLFSNPDELRRCAIIMVDADGLKTINDGCGHYSGDLYICGIVETLTRFGQSLRGKYLLSRNGGDEFVIFLYGYPDDDTLLDDIHTLRQYQDRETVVLSGGRTQRLHFSFGYSLRKDEETYYGELFRKADERMYENKRLRKAASGGQVNPDT